jgi:hypothetical protein
MHKTLCIITQILVRIVLVSAVKRYRFASTLLTKKANGCQKCTGCCPNSFLPSEAFGITPDRA